MPPHHALEVVEIVLLILELAVVESKADVACCAQTCHFLSKPALDILWRKLPYGLPLWKLLPPLRKVNNSIWELTKPPELGEWTRFDLYAKRVLELSDPFHSSCLAGNRGFTISGLDTHGDRPGITLLPSLRTLSIQGSCGRGTLNLISQTLLHFSCDIFQNTNIFGLLHTLALKAPKLQRLDLITSITPDAMQLITQLKHLRHLRYDDVSSYIPSPAYQEFFFRLSISDNLEYLDLQVRGSMITSFPETGGFRHLAEIHLSGNAYTILRFLGTISPSRLHTVVISLQDCDYFENWRACARQLQGLVDPDHHRFDSSSYRPTNTSSLPIIEAIQPLLGFHNLEIINISYEFYGEELTYPLPDTDVSSMALAWPRLTQIALFPGCKFASKTPSPSIQSLLSLVDLCSDLQDIRITLGQHDLSQWTDAEPSSFSMPDIEVWHPSPVDEISSIVQRMLPLATVRSRVWEEMSDSGDK